MGTTVRGLEQLVRSFFINRSDVLANMAPWNRPCPVEVNGELDDAIRAHLGEAVVELPHLGGREPGARHPVKRLGTYTPTADGMTRWVCFDIDGKGHADALEDPLAAAEEIIARLRKRSFPSYLERSGGGYGFHVWVFFSEPITARAARTVALACVDSVPAKAKRLKAGGQANVRKNSGLEVFPKTIEGVGDRGFGNMVWLPWWGGARQDCAQFYRPDEKQWHVYRPDTFELADAGEWSAIAAKLKQREKAQAESPKTNAKRTAVQRTAVDPSAMGWSEWRQLVLQRLDLRSVYGDLMKGARSTQGWFKVRDPWSPTGDRNLSGSIADTAREAERGTFHSFRTEESMSVFDYLVRRGVVSDPMGAFRYVAELTGMPMPPPKAKSDAPAPSSTPKTKESQRVPDDVDEPPPPDERDRPPPDDPEDDGVIIVNGRQLKDVIMDSWQAVRRAERPKLYVRDGSVVRVTTSHRGARIEAMARDAMHGALIRAGRWVKVKLGKDGPYYVDEKPPSEVAADMLAYPHPGLPNLTMVVHAPVVDAEGRIILEHGFDSRSGIYHHRELELAGVDESPSMDDVVAARRLIAEDLLVDFPFCSDADRAGAYAALFGPFLRPYITSSTPIHLLEAPVAGSGKSLIADLVHILFTGRTADVMTLPNEDEEARKRITSLLMTGRPLVTFDNLPHGSKSAALAAAITAHVWSDRILGSNRIVEMDNRATWLVTVNNPDFNIDLARRCLRIRIDPDSGRPWERQKFKHSNLRAWTRENRPKLVHALLTLLRFWLAKGAPLGDRKLGSFDHWSRCMSGLLDNIGVPGFLSNAHELYEQADSDTGEWLEFVAVWWDRHGGTACKASLLADMVQAEDIMPSLRGRSAGLASRLGKALGRMRGRVVGDWKVGQMVDRTTKGRLYYLERIEEGGTT